MAHKQRRTKPSKKRIKGFLGNSVYRQAAQLHDSGLRISYETVDYEKSSEVLTDIEGEIGSQSEDGKRVRITLLSNGFVLNSTCSCTDEPPCSHIGALLLEYIGEDKYPATSGPGQARGGSEKRAASPVNRSVSAKFIEYTRFTDPNIQINFEAAELHRNSVLFRPVYRFSAPSPVSREYRDISIERTKKTGTCLLYCHSRKILWESSKIDTPTEDLLKTGALRMSEIHTLRTQLKAAAGVSLDFTYSDYLLSSKTAVPVIDITEYREGITLKLTYRIDTTLFDFDLHRSFYARETAGGKLELNFVPPNQSSGWFEQVREKLGKTVIREEPSGSRYHFTAKLSSADFILSHAAALIEEGFEIRTQGTPLRRKSSGSFGLRVSVRNNWLEVEAGERTESGLQRFDFDPAAIESGIISTNGEFLIIDKSTIEKLRKLRLFGLDTRGRVTIPTYNPAFWKEFAGDIRSDDSAELVRIRESLASLENFTGLMKLEEPEGFQGTLRKYQKAGLSWLLFLRDYHLGGVLAEDMGLGKTIQTLALLQQSKNEAVLTRALVVAPVSTLPNWQNEIERFTPQLSVYRYHGQQRDTGKIKQHDIVLTSYATLRNDIEFFLKEDISYLILDEAQAIKNAASQTFKAVKMLSASHRLALSGTPLENSLIELWAQFDFLLPGLLDTRKRFYERFVKDIEQEHFHGESSATDEKTALLRSMIHPFVLRRTKQTVAPDLPEKEEILLYAEMQTDQAEFYHNLREHYREKVHSRVEREGIKKSTVTILEALLRLRQAAIFPSLISDEYRNISSCKFELLREALEDITAEGYKAVVFSQFIGSLKRIEALAAKADYGYAYLDGSTKDRREQIDLFQNDPNIRLFLLSLKAGGLGINLTAADYVFLFDPWWNPAVERQAIDRVHRIGRNSKVIAYRYIVKTTVEEKILTLQKHKTALAEEIVAEESSFVKSLNREDLEYLFS